MIATPTTLTEVTAPTFVIAVFRDPNGNWFSQLEDRHSDGSVTTSYTKTYTEVEEAVKAAMFMRG